MKIHGTGFWIGLCHLVIKYIVDIYIRRYKIYKVFDVKHISLNSQLVLWLTVPSIFAYYLAISTSYNSEFNSTRKLIRELSELWSKADLEERRKLLTAMLDAHILIQSRPNPLWR